MNDSLVGISKGANVILEDAASIKAALATMNPIARNATQFLAQKILEDPQMLQRDEGVRKQALYACAAAFSHAGYDLDRDEIRFRSFLEDHFVNVHDIGVSIVICMAKSEKRKEMWGNVGKVAAFVGGIALGAFFG